MASELKKPSKLSEAIIRCLDEAQDNVSSHPKLAKILFALYGRQEPDKFFQVFFPPFSNVLLVYKREAAAERVISFVSTFAVTTAALEESK